MDLPAEKLAEYGHDRKGGDFTYLISMVLPAKSLQNMATIVWAAISRNFHGFTDRKLTEYGHDRMGGDFTKFPSFYRQKACRIRPRWFSDIVGVHGRRFHVISMVFIGRKLAESVGFLAVLFFILLFCYVVCCYLNAMTVQKRGPSRFTFWGNLGSSPKNVSFSGKLWNCSLSKNQFFNVMVENDKNFVFIEHFLISQLRICLKIWDTSQMSLSWKTPIICCYSLFWKWKRGQIWIIWEIATIWITLTKPISIKKSNILDYIIFRNGGFYSFWALSKVKFTKQIQKLY